MKKTLLTIALILASLMGFGQVYNPGGTVTDSISAFTGDVVTVHDTLIYPNQILQLETIAELEAYEGESTTVFVKDSLRGGIFNYKASGLTADNGVVFDHANSGYWKRQYKEELGVNVDWFGADPTGTSDNSDILEKLMLVGGKLNFHPNGVYKITHKMGDADTPGGGLEVLLNNITLNGNNATIIADPASEIYHIFGFEAHGINININGLTFDGNNLANRLIYFRNITDSTSNVKIEDVKLKNAYAGAAAANQFQGINLYGKFEFIDFDNLSFDDFTGVGHGGNAIIISGYVDNGWVAENVSLNNITANNFTGTSCDVISIKYFSKKGEFRNIKIDSVTTSTQSKGISIENSINASIANNSVSNFTAGTNSIGLNVTGTNLFTVSNNKVSNIDASISRGIQVSDGSTNGSIQGNNISSITSDNDADGIYVLNPGEVTNVIISDNIIGDFSKRAIKINADFINISDNLLYNDLDESVQSFISIISAKNVKISGNNMVSTITQFYRCIILNNASEIDVSNNILKADFTSAWIGILGNPCDNIKIADNYFNMLPSSNTTNGIYFLDDCEDVNIDGNIFKGRLYNRVIRFDSMAKRIYINRNQYTDSTLTSGFAYMVSTSNNVNDSIVATNNQFITSENLGIIQPTVGFTEEINNTINGRTEIRSNDTYLISPKNDSIPLTLKTNEWQTVALKLTSDETGDNNRPSIYQYALRNSNNAIGYAILRGFIGHDEETATQAFDLSVFGHVGSSSNTVSYLGMSSSSTGAFNNAAFKLTPVGNVGIGLSGTTTPTERLEVNGNGKFTGTVTIADATADNEAVNLGQLSDYAKYEQGTFSPDVVGSTSGTYNLGSCPYTRIGNQVTVWVSKSFDSTGLVGDVSLTGLPYEASHPATAVLSHDDNNVVYSGDTRVSAVIHQNTSVVGFYFFPSDDVLTNTDFSSNPVIVFQLTYLTDEPF